jgi:hypothetical protein
MPEKKTKADKRYNVDGKVFTWTTDEGAEIKIPMRIKLGVIRAMADRELSTDVMFEMIDKIAPGQADVLDEQDVNDFQQMFVTWQAEYNKLSGASLGE